MPKPRPETQESIPVVREDLHVGKRRRETGKVIVKKTVSSRQKVIDTPLIKETVKVERVPVKRYVTQAEPMRQEGDVTIIPLYEEVLVVEKKLLLREEVRIIRERTEMHSPREITLRAEEVHVERQGPTIKGSANDQE